MENLNDPASMAVTEIRQDFRLPYYSFFLRLVELMKAASGDTRMKLGATQPATSATTPRQMKAASDGTRMKLGATQRVTTATTPRQARNPRVCRRAWSSIRPVLAAGLVAACGSGVSAHTLYVETCDETAAETGGYDLIEFTFCQSDGLYCDPTEPVDTPEYSGFDEVGGTVAITVSLGYTPTTMKIATESEDAWCITSVMWNDEEGTDLLGSDSQLYLDDQTGTDDDGKGCDGNGLHYLGMATCSSSWVFFNLDGSSNEYKVGVEACEGTSSARVNAYFCSHVFCNGTIGDEVEVELTTSDEEGGWEYTTFSADFNPVAMRLVEVEDQDVTWCAETVSYNFFMVIEDISTDDFEIDESGNASIIVQNIQHNGYSTPAPTSAPISADDEDSSSSSSSSSESRWLDATWEIVVTVVAALVVAGGSMLCKWWLSRRDSSSNC